MVVFFLSKSKLVAVRISVEDHDFVKRMGVSFSEIWQIGFEKWALGYPDFLQEKVQEYKNLYIQCINKMQDCNNNVYTKRRDLDELYRVYVEQGRSVQHPQSHDRSWVKGRTSKLKNKISVDQFFEYCCKRFEDEKQKKLEVIE